MKCLGSKAMRKLRWGFGVSIYASAALFLAACGSKLPTPPDTYVLNGESVPSFNAVLGEDSSGTMTTMETADTGADTSASKSGASSSGAASSAEKENQYAYDKLTSGGDAVSQYVKELTSGEDAFSVVDESGTQTDPPDYTTETGAVILARSASENGKILKMEISWTAADCQITLTRPAGEIQPPAVEPMTNLEAVEYLQGLPPTELGLTGSSMKEYRIYPLEGMVMVNGVACLKMQAYQVDGASHSNRIAGVYLLSGDKTHLYRLENGAVRELHAL